MEAEDADDEPAKPDLRKAPEESLFELDDQPDETPEAPASRRAKKEKKAKKGQSRTNRRGPAAILFPGQAVVAVIAGALMSGALRAALGHAAVGRFRADHPCDPRPRCARPCAAQDRGHSEHRHRDRGRVVRHPRSARLPPEYELIAGDQLDKCRRSPRRDILVGLSTASVYPQNTEAAFRMRRSSATTSVSNSWRGPSRSARTSTL